MKETLIDVETGEKIIVNTEGTYDVSQEQKNLVWRTFLKNKIKLFSNTEKKKYIIGKRNPKTQHIN
jgi:hypothetical protein